MKPTQSIGNLSRDSGVPEMDNRSSGHSRSASSATSNCSTDTGYNEIQCNEKNNLTKYGKCHYYGKNSIFRINKRSLIILISFIITLSCCLLLTYLPFLLTKIVQTIINIDPDGEFYEFWKQSTEPTEVGLHFFHVENPWAVENGLEKLKVKETGRYFFKQRFVRDVHNFSDDKTLVQFTEKRFYYFDEVKTQLSLDANITIVNVPFAALSSLVPRFVSEMMFFSYLSYSTVNSFLGNHKQSLFINTTVRQLLYGYRLDILDTAESYNSLLSKIGLDIMPDDTSLFPNNSFGILHGRNGTPDGPYEMYTGLMNTQHKFGHIKSWNHTNKMKFWKADSCNAIKGTDGTMWPAGVSTKDRLEFFIPDVCRSLYVTFKEKSSYKGIETYLFSAPDQLLAGRRTNPENECFCLEEDEDLAEQRCIDGIFDLSGCQNGIPIIISLPHFLGSDKRISEEIVGLKPEEEKHRPVLHVEPTMGLVIHGDSRLQMSIRVTPNENMIGFNKLKKEMYIPIFWGYKKLGMSDEMAVKLKQRLFSPVKIIKITLILFILGSLLFSIFGFIKWILLSNNMVIQFPRETSKMKNRPEETKITIGMEEEEGKLMPRIESATSDLGDNKSDSSSLKSEDSPTSSLIEFKLLINAAETDI